MSKVIFGILIALLIIVIALFSYGVKGWYDATQDAPSLRGRADELISKNISGQSLGQERLFTLLQVQDPGFYDHAGVDLTTPGAGITTITQSLSKRLAFEKFKPGIGKIRQTGYALGLEQNLSKVQIMALFLDTLEMGQSDEGWITGFHNASQDFFGATPSEISDAQFYMLVAVLIAPGKLKLSQPDSELAERIARIKRLVGRECEPLNARDVWFKGCKSSPN